MNGVCVTLTKSSGLNKYPVCGVMASSFDSIQWKRFYLLQDNSGGTKIISSWWSLAIIILIHSMRWWLVSLQWHNISLMKLYFGFTSFFSTDNDENDDESEWVSKLKICIHTSSTEAEIPKEPSTHLWRSRQLMSNSCWVTDRPTAKRTQIILKVPHCQPHKTPSSCSV